MTNLKEGCQPRNQHTSTESRLQNAGMLLVVVGTRRSHAATLSGQTSSLLGQCYAPVLHHGVADGMPGSAVAEGPLNSGAEGHWIGMSIAQG